MVEPAPLSRQLELVERGPEVGRSARALVANLPGSIARRELAAFSQRVSWPADALHVTQVEGAPGPGNVIGAEIEYAHVTFVATAFGERRVLAEQVGRDLGVQVRSYLARGAPVGPHLADQLVLPLALGVGGVFVTGPLTQHCRTHLDVVRQLLGVGVEVGPAGEDRVRVEITPRPEASPGPAESTAD